MKITFACTFFLVGCAYFASAGTIRREKRGSIQSGNAASIDPAELAKIRAAGGRRTKTRTSTRTGTGVHSRTRTGSRTRSGTRTATRTTTRNGTPIINNKSSRTRKEPEDLDLKPIPVNPKPRPVEPKSAETGNPPTKPNPETGSTNSETPTGNVAPVRRPGVPGRPDIDENGVPGLAKVASVGAGANILGVDAGDKLAVQAGNQGGGVRAFQGADISGVHPALRGWKPFGPEQRAGYDCGNIGIGQGVGLGPIGSINTGSIDLPLGSAFGKDKFGGKGCQTDPGQSFTSG